MVNGGGTNGLKNGSSPAGVNGSTEDEKFEVKRYFGVRHVRPFSSLCSLSSFFITVSANQYSADLLLSYYYYVLFYEKKNRLIDNE